MFVDTSAWVALVVERDARHAAAKDFLAAHDPRSPLFTSDYVFDETITRVRRQSGHRIAVQVGELMRSSTIAQVVDTTQDDIERAWAVFRKHADKELSFTDSFIVAVMERLKIRSIFAFDDDFRKLGFTVEPAPSG